MKARGPITIVMPKPNHFITIIITLLGIFQKNVTEKSVLFCKEAGGYSFTAPEAGGYSFTARPSIYGPPLSYNFSTLYIIVHAKLGYHDAMLSKVIIIFTIFLH